MVRAASGHSSAVQSRLVARSVEIILDGQAASGAYAASPTFPQYRDFCWFRDGAFIAEAMSRVGETESAERFFDWCAGIVRRSPAGPWDSRYRLDGSVDPVAWWPHRQFDGLGLWVWAMENHVERHGVSSRWSDAAEATQVFLSQHWSEPCHDWWEEHESHADGEGALPEQSGEQLRPALYGTWVARWGQPAVPLLWSHAMYLILEAMLTG